MIDAAFKAFAQMFTPALRGVLVKAVGLAVLLIVFISILLQRLFVHYADTGASWAEQTAGVAPHAAWTALAWLLSILATFGIVTGAVEGDEDSIPELWLLDGDHWSQPIGLPLGGKVLSISSGPYGMLVVGTNAKGTRARALFTSYDGQTSVYARGVSDKPGLLVGLCSGERLSWAAGEGLVLGLDRGTVINEDVEAKDRPVAMGLDPVGIPWLVTNSSVMRRQATTGPATWRVYYEKDTGAPPLVGITFTDEGVRVIDARGGGAKIIPRDVSGWRSTSMVLDAT